MPNGSHVLNGRTTYGNVSNIKLTPVKKAIGLVAVVVLGPLAVVLGAAAALFFLNQFFSGMIPSRWCSSSPPDWAFGTGTAGSASNYLGFMVCGVPAWAAFVGVQWGLEKLRTK